MKLYYSILPAISVLMVCSFAGCSDSEVNKPHGTETFPLPVLAATEIREYEGENLSSSADFRENAIKGPQNVAIDSYTLTIHGLAAKPALYTYNELLTSNPHYKKKVTLNCVEGWSVTILWEGLLINDLLEKIEPLPSATTIIFRAADGYSTSFPLEYITDNNILIAYALNDIELPPDRGYPFILVAESKWGYKWIKWITEIELSDNEKYRGYWESYGYSNDGDLDKSKYDHE